MKKVQVTVILPDEEEHVAVPDYNFCYQCKYFTQHYVRNRDGRFIPLDWGHCYPPRKYSYIKNHKSTQCACCWFKNQNDKEDT